MCWSLGLCLEPETSKMRGKENREERKTREGKINFFPCLVIHGKLKAKR